MMEPPWRTEPEITVERQRDLEQYRATPADIAAQRYPFAAVTPPLSRADIEYLLATLEQGCGPILWNDKAQREREGLDLRGVHFPKQTNLSGLPFARTRFGIMSNSWGVVSVEQREAAAAHLEGANLRNAHLEGAILSDAHLEDAILRDAHLEGADLRDAHLEGADLSDAHLEGTHLFQAHLEGAFLFQAHLEGAHLLVAHLEGANIRDAHLEGANLSDAHLEGANLEGANLERAILSEAHLEEANLFLAHLEGTNLFLAHLKGADLRNAHLEGANIRDAHLEGANLSLAHLEGANLEATRLSDEDYYRIQAAKREYGITVPQALPPADLRGAFFDTSTQLNDIVIGNKMTCIRVADVRWNGANLAVIPWQDQHIQRLGDEIAAAHTKGESRKDQRRAWEEAVRAYRQLAVTLRDQGINELADQFAYHAQLCQRRLLRLQRQRGAYVWSHVLNGLAGYGFQPLRTLRLYLFLIAVYALGYGIIGHTDIAHLSPLGALVFSITSFHGRGFFPGGIALDDPLTVLAASEAILGLIIEVSFIATFTQRFFGK